MLPGVPAAECRDDDGSEEGRNSYAAYPSLRGMGRHYALTVTCVGEINQEAGYLVDIKAIDRVVRAACLPVLEGAVARGEEPFSAARRLGAALAGQMGGMASRVRWWLDPFFSLEVGMKDADVVLMRQKFDFAAAHRLHVPMWSEEENRRAFGKCNNARGHGHNYQVEPCVAIRVGEGRPGFTLQDLEAITDRAILRRFDHKHLNEDTTEFATHGGLNPSVENIAKVFFEILSPEIERAGGTARLRSITVWETDRTSATYPVGQGEAAE